MPVRNQRRDVHKLCAKRNWNKTNKKSMYHGLAALCLSSRMRFSSSLYCRSSSMLLLSSSWICINWSTLGEGLYVGLLDSPVKGTKGVGPVCATCIQLNWLRRSSYYKRKKTEITNDFLLKELTVLDLVWQVDSHFHSSPRHPRTWPADTPLIWVESANALHPSWRTQRKGGTSAAHIRPSPRNQSACTDPTTVKIRQLMQLMVHMYT